jgi:hypothetical protein
MTFIPGKGTYKTSKRGTKVIKKGTQHNDKGWLEGKGTQDNGKGGGKMPLPFRHFSI